MENANGRGKNGARNVYEATDILAEAGNGIMKKGPLLSSWLRLWTIKCLSRLCRSRCKPCLQQNHALTLIMKGIMATYALIIFKEPAGPQPLMDRAQTVKVEFLRPDSDYRGSR